uniref:Uncharacterized protein n=1 Tax=Anguilla anguilla TaxID=7936 RepID=A0A0E9UKX6_ANGAN
MPTNATVASMLGTFFWISTVTFHCCQFQFLMTVACNCKNILYLTAEMD